MNSLLISDLEALRMLTRTSDDVDLLLLHARAQGFKTPASRIILSARIAELSQTGNKHAKAACQRIRERLDLGLYNN